MILAMRIHYRIIFLLFFLPSLTHANTAAKVELLQSNVWLERQGQRIPLTTGDELRNKDKIITGNRARVLLRLNDDSVVKLGEDAEFIVEELIPPNQEGDVLSGFLNVLKGAFRYTTSVISNNYRRDLKVQVSTATIGIRGTDVWGKAEPTRDFVVLLEGEISIERDNQSYQLTDALTLFMAPKGEAPEPLQPVNMDDLEIWAQETEPQPEKGIRTTDGIWKVILASYEQEQIAIAKQNQISNAGFATSIEQVSINGQTWYRLIIDKIQGKLDAQFLLNDMQTQYGFQSSWITNR